MHVDQVIHFLQLVGHQDEVGENKYEMSLLTATAGPSGIGPAARAAGEKARSQLSKVTSSL